MRIFHPLCALVLAAAAPAALLAQDSAPSGAAPTTTAAAKKEPVKKKPVKRAGPPAKELFGAAKSPAPMEARAIGFYAKGCLAGAAALPTDGEAWQAMRLSRNRNWGHPKLVALVEKLALEAKTHDGWSGLLVGDLSQPRGGPMLTGHASHQVGLDADIWLTPMPDRRLTNQEREDLSATTMLADDKVSVDPKIWTDAHARLIKRAASYSAVERIFVHPAIKKALCDGGRQRQGPRLAEEGARLLGPPLSLPHPHRLSRRQRQLRGPAIASRRRRLRRRAQELAGAGEAEAPEAQAGGARRARQACAGETRHHARAASRRMQGRAGERERRPAQDRGAGQGGKARARKIVGDEVASARLRRRL